MGERRYGPEGRGLDPWQIQKILEQGEALKAALAEPRKNSKAAPEKRTGQNGPPLELPADRLNEHEAALARALFACPGCTSTLSQLAMTCFPGDAQANSRARNSLRRLIRGTWLTKEARGRYSLTALGRSRAQGL